MYRILIYIYIYTLNPRKNQVVQELARQNETEWGKRSNEKYNRFLKRRNKEKIQWQIDLFESEKCKRKLKTTKPEIKKQLDKNHSIPLSQIEIPIILEPLQQQKPPIQKNLLQSFWGRPTSISCEEVARDTSKSQFSSVFDNQRPFRAKGLRGTLQNRNFTEVLDVQRPFRAKGLRFVALRRHRPRLKRE